MDTRGSRRSVKGRKIAEQLAGELAIHPMVLSEWKKTFMESGSQIFEREAKVKGTPEEKDELFEQIGRLNMELEYLKKN